MLLFDANVFTIDNKYRPMGAPDWKSVYTQNYVEYPNEDPKGNVITPRETYPYASINAVSMTNVVITSVPFNQYFTYPGNVNISSNVGNALLGFASLCNIVELGQRVCTITTAAEYASRVLSTAPSLKLVNANIKIAVNGETSGDYQSLMSASGGVIDFLVGTNVNTMMTGLMSSSASPGDKSRVKLIVKANTFGDVSTTIANSFVEHIIAGGCFNDGNGYTPLGMVINELLHDTAISGNIDTIVSNNVVVTMANVNTSLFKQQRVFGLTNQKVLLNTATSQIHALYTSVGNVSVGNASLYVGNIAVSNVVRPSINMNYLVDSDLNRSPGYIPIANAMTNLAPEYIRFSGEEAQSYSWATTPDWLPNSHTLNLTLPSQFPASMPAYWNSNKLNANVMNYDQIWAVANAANARMINTICMNSMYNTVTPVSKTLLMETAGQWVKYAKTSGKTAAIWEMGNETDMDAAYNGFTTPSIYAADAEDFIANMRAYDDVYTIVNASTAAGWEIVNTIPNANAIVVHTYPIYAFPGNTMYGEGNVYYLQYSEHNYNGDVFSNQYTIYNSGITTALYSITKPLHLTETNVTDFSAYNGFPGWPLVNDIARMLLLVDMYIAQSPNVVSWVVWSTRWTDTPGKNSNLLFGVFDNLNALLPTGEAFKMISYTTKGYGNVLNSYSTNQYIKILPVLNDTGINLLIVNKSSIRQDLDISIRATNVVEHFTVYGNHNSSTSVLRAQGTHTISRGHVSTQLYPLSLTFMRLT